MAILFAASFTFASNGPLVTGSYQVVKHTKVGSEAQIQIHIHLVNHGASNLFVQKMTLRDLSHPGKGVTRACAVALRAHGSADTTQALTIPQSEYQLWQKGVRPRFVLRMASPGNPPGRTNISAVVRLDRSSGQEAR